MDWNTVFAVILFICSAVMFPLALLNFNKNRATTIVNRLIRLIRHRKIAEDERETIDDIKLARFNGVYEILLSVLVLLLGFYYMFERRLPFTMQPILLIALPICYTIFIRKFVFNGKLFRKHKGEIE